MVVFGWKISETPFVEFFYEFNMEMLNSPEDKTLSNSSCMNLAWRF